MMRSIMAFVCGGLFGAGLLISGMTDTRKVRGWLDFFGDWDPTLAFVMGGAILPMMVAWRMTSSRKPAFAESFPTEPRRDLDFRLIFGSVLFGLGWGLVGLCPGPAIASITYGGPAGLVFLIAMIAGMFVAVPMRRAQPT